MMNLGYLRVEKQCNLALVMGSSMHLHWVFRGKKVNSKDQDQRHEGVDKSQNKVQFK